MQGMELAKKYYETYGAPMIAETCGDLADRIAVGLVGEGSQCFGFDDVISQDHDFGPGFCIWMREQEYTGYGEKLAAAYQALPEDFLGFTRRNLQDQSRVGVMTVKGFYRKYLGLEQPPDTNRAWLFLKETDLALCTNGAVFRDECGEFTGFREALLQFYPPDILRKKIAARAAVMSQAGQYNLLRCLRRQDAMAAMFALSRFTESALSMLYLLNRRYMPFYKWAFHGARKLENMQQTVQKIGNLPQIFTAVNRGDFAAAEKLAFEQTEMICEDTVRELNRQEFSQSRSAFLQEHLPDIMAEIRDEQIRRLPPIFDYGI